MADEKANPNTEKITKALLAATAAPDGLAALGSSLKPFEEWAAAKNTPDWQLAGLVADQKWPTGREVSEKQFETALEVMLNAPLGANAPKTLTGEAE